MLGLLLKRAADAKTESAAKKLKKETEPLLDRYPTAVIRLSGSDTVPPLSLVQKGGSADCWKILDMGFSKYEHGFDDMIVCNECLSEDCTKRNAEFSYGATRSTSNVWHHISAHHTAKFTQCQLEKERTTQAATSKLLRPSSSITSHFTPSGSLYIFVLNVA